MKKKQFCCDASKHMYETYYADQSGGNGMPYFAGSRGQRGHGLGSLLGGLFRSAMPMIKRGLAAFGKHALRTGLTIANDVAEGESVKASARRRIPESIKRMAGFPQQRGSGIASIGGGGGGRRRTTKRKRPRASAKSTAKKGKGKKKRKLDIFG